MHKKNFTIVGFKGVYLKNKTREPAVEQFQREKET